MHTLVGARTLKSLLEGRAARTPSATFVVFDDLAGGVETVSYAAFDRRVNRAAHALRALGLEAGETINVHLPNSMAFLYLWFGAAKLGVRVMPTNPLASVAELSYLIEHSSSRFTFTSSEHLATAQALSTRCPSLQSVISCTRDCAHEPRLDALMAAQPDTAPSAAPQASDVVGILYTSGTTAQPKGVLVTNANYIYAGETVAKAVALRPHDRHLAVLPLFHGNAQYYSTMSALVTGASVVIAARFSASRYFDTAIAHGCTVASLFAAPIRMLLAQPPRPALRENAIRVALFAQCITSAQLEEWMRRFGAPLLQIWGMTETMGPPLMNPLDDVRDNMSIGLASLGYRVKLVSETGVEVPCGEIGQIVVEGVPGETLMAGYFRDADATARTLRDGWLWSGDNARRDARGFFHFVDRAKDMIKRAGENVAASEVESVIMQHCDVFDCAVIGVPDAMRDEAIRAYVVLREGAQLDGDAIIDWCRERLAAFRVPNEVVFRDTLPRTSVGKIQKHRLREEGG